MYHTTEKQATVDKHKGEGGGAGAGGGGGGTVRGFRISF